MRKPLLSKIDSPRDLKRLSYQERVQLAAELRETIIATISRTGGHLGAGLGAVELAIAIHTVFDSPTDKIIWDVGHQSYPHKLLTGRRERFHTIRQTGGLSGFPKRSESEHDAFGTAHASTALSAAYGYAKARDLRGERYAVVAVVGDGALTGGLAYEGLNNIGHDGTDLIVILNDNSMSIAPNVGAISAYLRRIRTDPAYVRLRRDLDRLLQRIPAIGSQVARVVGRVREGIKHLILPGQFFEELGFRYLGPIDGHDLRTLEETLRRARRVGGPVVIHAVTVKGKGYKPAEERPYVFHGPGPFQVETGEAVTKPAGPPSYSSVFAQTLIRLAARDERICAITAAMPDGTGLEAFRKVYPDRFFDVGIAEQHAVTMAAGLACGGMRPVVAVYSTFLQRAYDQVIHDVAIQKLPVVFCLDRAGIVGADGETHQGAFDLAYLRCVPEMVIAAPKDERELQDLLATALAYESGPFALRYPRGAGVGVPLADEAQPLPVGRGELLREGTDVALIGVGPLVYRALEAATRLAAEGIEAAVINARFVKPLDEALLLDVLARVPAVVTFEEGTRIGGLGSAVLELCADHGLSPRVVRLGLPDRFVEHGDPEHFRRQFGLTVEGMCAAVWRAVGHRADGEASKMEESA